MQFTFLGDNSPKPFSFDYLGDNTPPAAAPAPAAEEDDEDEEDALDDHEALDHIGDVGPEVFVDYSTFEDRDGSDGSTQEEAEENPMRAPERRGSAALEFDDFLGGGGDYEEEPEANPMARHGGAPKKRGSAAFVDAAASSATWLSCFSAPARERSPRRIWPPETTGTDSTTTCWTPSKPPAAGQSTSKRTVACSRASSPSSAPRTPPGPGGRVPSPSTPRATSFLFGVLREVTNRLTNRLSNTTSSTELALTVALIHPSIGVSRRAPARRP